MKNSKLLISCLFLMVVLLMSSCLDSSEGNSKQTFYSYATVVAKPEFKLLSDDGVVLIPSQSSLDKLKDLSKEERVYVGYTLQEGQVVTETKKSYYVDLIGYAPVKTDGILAVNDVNASANDTLTSNNDPVIDFDFIATRNYVTVQSKFNYVYKKTPVMLVWKDERKINKDTLFLNLYYNDRKEKNEELGFQPAGFIHSFRLGDLNVDYPKKESVIVALTGVVNNEIHYNKSIKKTFKVALN